MTVWVIKPLRIPFDRCEQAFVFWLFVSIVWKQKMYSTSLGSKVSWWGNRIFEDQVGGGEAARDCRFDKESDVRLHSEFLLHFAVWQSDNKQFVLGYYYIFVFILWPSGVDKRNGEVSSPAICSCDFSPERHSHKIENAFDEWFSSAEKWKRIFWVWPISIRQFW